MMARIETMEEEGGGSREEGGGAVETVTATSEVRTV